MVHGDDCVSVWPPKQLKWFEEQFKMKYQITTQVLGPDPEQSKEVQIVNRSIICHDSKA